MSKFKVGDDVFVVGSDACWYRWVEPLNKLVGNRNKYRISKIEKDDGLLVLKLDVNGTSWWLPAHCCELAEDRTNWHPHADVIIAWAKGKKIQGRPYRVEWTDFVRPHNELTPRFDDNSIEWRIKPDNSEEIDRIKQEIQDHGKAIDELQAKLKELES